MNAHSPLIGVHHGPIILNITINLPAKEGADPRVVYVNRAGDAGMGEVPAVAQTPEPEPEPIPVTPTGQPKLTPGRVVHYTPTREQRVQLGYFLKSPIVAFIVGVFPAGDGVGEVASLFAVPVGRKPFVVPECVRLGRPHQPGTFVFPPRV